MKRKIGHKLQSIFIPVLFFIVFDLSALALNFWISFQLEKSAVAINLSGRQRMLSQRMTKSLLIFQNGSEPAQRHVAFEEFVVTVNLFDKTLHGFSVGGMTDGGDGKPIFLPALDQHNAQLITATAVEMWSEVHEHLHAVIEQNQSANSAIVQDAVDYLLVYNGKLLKVMNDLTTTLEKNATRDIGYLRLFQAAVLCMALVNFLLVCKRLLSRVKQSQQNADSLNNIIDSIETGVILSDSNDVITSANKAAIHLFGYHDQNLAGKRMAQLLFMDGQRPLGVRRDDSTFIAEINYQTLFEGSNQINICTVADVSAQIDKERHLSELAFHDALTGLPNRVLFRERLRQELLHAKRNSSLLGLLFADLDGFKAVNDSLGHDAGDELLQAVGKRLQQCCREDDTVARLGGDEFVFVLASIPTKQAARQVAENIIKSINQAFLIHHQTVQIGISIGIAIYPTDHSEEELLIKYADDAMYHAKQAGKNQFYFAAELHGR